MERSEIEALITQHERHLGEHQQTLANLRVQLETLSAQTYAPYQCQHCKTVNEFGKMILVRYYFWYQDVRDWWSADRKRDYLCCPQCFKTSTPTGIHLEGMLRDPDIFADQIESQVDKQFGFVRIDSVKVLCHLTTLTTETLTEIHSKRALAWNEHQQLERRKVLCACK